MSLWQLGAGERVLIRKLSDTGALLIAFQRKQGRCWDRTPHNANKDVHQVVDVLVALLRLYPNLSLSQLPLTSIGVSGGTAFQTMLSIYLRFRSMAVYIGPVHAKFLSSSLVPACECAHWSALPRKWRMKGPPNVLMHYMPADANLRATIMRQVPIMQSKGIPVHIIEAHPWFVTPLTLYLWMPSRLQQHESAMLYHLLAPLFNSTYAPGVSHVRINADTLHLRPTY
jgi:hypothetical protein